MPIHRLTVCCALATALLAMAPAQAHTSKSHGKPVHAKKHVQHHHHAHAKLAHHKALNRKSAHGKLAVATHKSSRTHALADAAAPAPTRDSIPGMTQGWDGVATVVVPSSYLTIRNGSGASVGAAPAWLQPATTSADILLQSSQPARVAVLATASPASDTPSPEASEGGSITDLRKSLIAMAMELRDIRYVRGGHDPSTGFDCSGFVRYVFAHAIGMQLPTNSASQFLAGLKVRRADMKPGDLVFFRTHGKRRISHVGIYISDGHFIHSPASGKSVEISSLNDAYWAKRFAGAKRPEGMAQVASRG
jgi:cell wall-associated NlpC family hydrolase